MVEESRARPPNSTKVFVGNISATCSADDLHGLFSTFGRVLDCDKVKGGLLFSSFKYVEQGVLHGNNWNVTHCDT